MYYSFALAAIEAHAYAHYTSLLCFALLCFALMMILFELHLLYANTIS